MHGPNENARDEAIAEMNVIPFIDICLVLLIIVLMTSASQSNFKKLDLPSLEARDFRDMNLAITLSVTEKTDDNSNPILDAKGGRQYAYYFEEDQTPIDPKNLWTYLKSVQQDNNWSMLVLRTGKDCPFEYLQRAIQCAQSLGVNDVNFAVASNQQEDNASK